MTDSEPLPRREQATHDRIWGTERIIAGEELIEAAMDWYTHKPDSTWRLHRAAEHYKKVNQ